jgi:3-deoxy-D-manno-octulosonic-acid transferase
MIYLYNILALILAPIWLLVLWKSQKDLRLKERLGFLPKRKDAPIWVHSVSLGEAKIGVNLINALKEKGLSVFATTTTSSGKGEFEKNRIESSFFPLDFILFMKIALRRVKPSALVMVETEIWPSLFYLCAKRNISVFIVNARLSDKKLNYYVRYEKLFAEIIKKVWILCSSEEYKKRFIEIGAEEERILVTGNMKFDIDFPEENKLSQFKISVRDFLKENAKMWVAGSVREGEEEKILKCHQKVSQHIEKARVIIAPRHLNRVGKIIEMCAKFGLKPILRSEFPSKEWDVLILDTYGELIYAYSLAPIAFVGGSLEKFGGQNPLEPSVYKSAVLIGKSFENFYDEVENMNQNGGVIIVNDENELSEKIIYLFDNEEDRMRIGESGYKVISTCKGATFKNVSFIAEKILCYQNEVGASI